MFKFLMIKNNYELLKIFTIFTILLFLIVTSIAQLYLFSALSIGFSSYHPDDRPPSINDYVENNYGDYFILKVSQTFFFLIILFIVFNSISLNLYLENYKEISQKKNISSSSMKLSSNAIFDEIFTFSIFLFLNIILFVGIISLPMIIYFIIIRFSLLLFFLTLLFIVLSYVLLSLYLKKTKKNYQRKKIPHTFIKQIFNILLRNILTFCLFFFLYPILFVLIFLTANYLISLSVGYFFKGFHIGFIIDFIVMIIDFIIMFFIIQKIIFNIYGISKTHHKKE